MRRTAYLLVSLYSLVSLITMGDVTLRANALRRFAGPLVFLCALSVAVIALERTFRKRLSERWMSWFYLYLAVVFGVGTVLMMLALRQ